MRADGRGEDRKEEDAYARSLSVALRRERLSIADVPLRLARVLLVSALAMTIFYATCACAQEMASLNGHYSLGVGLELRARTGPETVAVISRCDSVWRCTDALCDAVNASVSFDGRRCSARPSNFLVAEDEHLVLRYALGYAVASVSLQVALLALSLAFLVRASLSRAWAESRAGMRAEGALGKLLVVASCVADVCMLAAMLLAVASTRSEILKEVWHASRDVSAYLLLAQSCAAGVFALDAVCASASLAPLLTARKVPCSLLQ